MKKKPKDRHLDIPSEANRDKHINFVAAERGEDDPADAPSTGKLASEEEKNKEKEEKKRQKNDSEDM